MAGIMELFSRKPAESAAPVAPVAPIEPVTPEPTGLDASAKWFEPAEGDAKPSNFDPAVMFEQSPESQQAIMAEVSKLNFLDGAATPEIMAAIQEGGDKATQAMAAVMNKVGQNAFSAALKASMQISQSAFTKAAPAIEGKISDQLRKNTFEDAVRTANPVLSHPSGKIIADALVPALMAKYPNATATEIKELANNYITDIATAGVPKSTDPGSAGKIETDWADFMKG